MHKTKRLKLANVWKAEGTQNKQTWNQAEHCGKESAQDNSCAAGLVTTHTRLQQGYVKLKKGSRQEKKQKKKK